MADEARRIDAGTLLAEIATKSGRPAEDVRAALTRHGVFFRPSLAVPKRLCIRSLRFTGIKQGEKAAGPIDFTWNDLGPGLWAITSGRNLRGKSTVLGIIRWCLNGRRGDAVPGEMKEWFHTVELGFTLDDQEYEVEIADAVAGTGTLWRVDGSTKRSLASFASEDEFESTMSDFFMGQLGLQPIVSHVVQGDRSIDQPHDWVWLSGALVIEPNPTVLFGAVATGGLATRMMQMYLGVPWTNANNDIVAAQGRLQNEARQTSAAFDRTRERRQARIKELDAEITDLQSKLKALPLEDDQRAELRRESAKFAEAEKRRRSALMLLGSIEADLESAKDAHARARRDLQDFKDSRAANYVFRSLEPVCCPRCDEVFDEVRRAETRNDHVCLVCGTPEEPEADPGTLEESLREAVADAELELARQRQRQEALTKTIADAGEAMDDAEAACRVIQARLAAPSGRRDVEIDILRKQAQREELAKEDAAAPSPNGDLGVLKAAEEVTKEAYRPLQDDLLSEVSELIQDYAVRFGVESLESVKLLGNTNLRLHKGGPPVYFGKQTAGERVRLKVAATLAIMKVAQTRGLGRHPGLLLIDSPGANEMVPQDFDRLISGLAELSGEIPHLQVLVAAVNSETIQNHVPPERRRSAAGDEYLW